MGRSSKERSRLYGNPIRTMKKKGKNGRRYLVVSTWLFIGMVMLKVIAMMGAGGSGTGMAFAVAGALFMIPVAIAGMNLLFAVIANLSSDSNRSLAITIFVVIGVPVSLYLFSVKKSENESMALQAEQEALQRIRPMFDHAVQNNDVDALEKMRVEGVLKKYPVLIELAMCNVGMANKATLNYLRDLGAPLAGDWRCKYTPLEEAAREVNVEAIQFFLASGADPLKIGEEGDTLIHKAIVHEFSDEIPKRQLAEAIDTLVKAGLSLNTRDSDGLTAIELAVKRGELNAIEVLLARDDIKLDKKQLGALTYQALERCSPEGAKLLIQRGADLRFQDGRGRNLLMMTTTLGDLDLSRTLIKAGINLNHVDKHGDNALAYMFSNKEDMVDFARLFVQSGISINHKNHAGLTALNYAYPPHHTSSLLFLEKHGARIGEKSERIQVHDEYKNYAVVANGSVILEGWTDGEGRTQHALSELPDDVRIELTGSACSSVYQNSQAQHEKITKKAK